MTGPTSGRAKLFIAVNLRRDRERERETLGFSSDSIPFTKIKSGRKMEQDSRLIVSRSREDLEKK